MFRKAVKALNFSVAADVSDISTAQQVANNVVPAAREYFFAQLCESLAAVFVISAVFVL
jgi:hypothetical protein